MDTPKLLAVLGMRSTFEQRAQEVINECITKNEPPAEHLFNFLNEAIDEVTDTGNGEIGRPSVLKLFNQNEFKKVKFTKA